MASNLKTDNASEFFSLAELHDATQLRFAAKQFIVTQFYDVKKTDGWKKLQSTSPQLTEEIIEELAELVHQLKLTE